MSATLLTPDPAWAQDVDWGCGLLPEGTAIDHRPLDTALKRDLSGATWDDHSQRLWLVRNTPSKPMIWSLQRQDERWEVAQTLTVSGSFDMDLEAIALFESRLLVLDEQLPGIHEVSKTDGSVVRTWTLPSQMAEDHGSGVEGLTHIPAGQFEALPATDVDGKLCPSCDPEVNALPGLFLLAHQRDGRIYAYRLEDGGPEVWLYGAYDTGADEAAGLEFIPDQNVLLVLHSKDPMPEVHRSGGLDNALEVVRLSRMASGQLEPVAYRPHPTASANLEGVAWIPQDPELVFTWDFGPRHIGKRTVALELPVLPCQRTARAPKTPPGSIDNLTPSQAWGPAAGLSDLVLYSSTLGTTLFYAGPELAGGDARPMVSVGVAQGVTYAVTTLTKSAAKRPRPYTYLPHYPHHSDPNRCADPKKLRDSDACHSFFSGHTSQTAAALFSVAASYQLFGPTDRPAARTAMWTGAGVGTGLVAGLRVGAKKHFMTDVLVGAIVGTGIGIGSAVATDKLLPEPR